MVVVVVVAWVLVVVVVVVVIAVVIIQITPVFKCFSEPLGEKEFIVAISLLLRVRGRPAPLWGSVWRYFSKQNAVRG